MKSDQMADILRSIPPPPSRYVEAPWNSGKASITVPNEACSRMLTKTQCNQCLGTRLRCDLATNGSCGSCNERNIPCSMADIFAPLRLAPIRTPDPVSIEPTTVPNHEPPKAVLGATRYRWAINLGSVPNQEPPKAVLGATRYRWAMILGSKQEPNEVPSLPHFESFFAPTPFNTNQAYSVPLLTTDSSATTQSDKKRI